VVPALRDQSPAAATHSSNGSSVSPESSPVGLVHSVDDHRRYLGGDQSNSFPNNSTGPHTQQLYPPAHQPAPPPVDFTGYSSNSVSLPHHPPPPPRISEGSERVNPKKRSIAAAASTESLSTFVSDHQPEVPLSTHLPPINPSGPSSVSNPGRLSSISSLLNHTIDGKATGDESHLDPSLAPICRPQRQLPARSFSPSQSHLATSAQIQARNSATTKAERRAQLQREAEDIREALRAKERELAELE
jgi:hypothetical protein